MNSAWINLPRHVIVGHGALDEVAAVIEDLRFANRALIVTSPTPRSIAGERIVSAVTAGGRPDPIIVEIEETGGKAVESVIEAASDVGYVIGLGGGKAIDVAKIASHRLEHGFISVPTAASHDGIVSGRASIPDGSTRHSVAADPPLAVVADTEVIANAPWTLTTAGCADIISNYTAVRDWRLAHRLHDVEYSEYAATLSEMTAEMLVDNTDSIRPGLEESAHAVMKALVSSGVAMSIAGSSRPASGAEHLVSHQLDRLAPGQALHGHQVGVASIVIAYLQTGETGDWQRIRDALRGLDAPTTAQSLGIEPETLIEALTTAHEIRDRYTILGNGISTKAAEEAATVTGVI